MRFFVRESSEESFETVVAAFDAESAAEDYAEQVYDNSAGEIDANKGLDIEVMDERGDVTRWHVEIEYAPSFSAYRAKDPT